MITSLTSATSTANQTQQATQQTAATGTSAFSDLLDATAKPTPSTASSTTTTILTTTPLLTVTTTSASSGTAYLLSVDALVPSAAMPSTAEFMAKAGVDSDTAVNALYGVIGSNKDYRDWSAIMASDTPLADARASTAAMYASSLPYAPENTYTPTTEQILAQSGQFAFVQMESSRPPALCIMDGEGHLLRQTGYDPVSVLQNVRDFGLDVTQLADIATQLDAKGIAYKPGELAPGSSLGTDFADLAKGGLGSSTDWRSDALAAYTNSDTIAQLARNQKLATEMGVEVATSITSSVLTAADSTSVAASPLQETTTQTITGTAHLLSVDALVPSAAMPSTAEFMAKAGVDSDTAVNALYGVIGSNKDYRDWSAIMASDTPLADARASTAAMYASSLPYAPENTYTPTTEQILAQSGQFAFVQMESSRPPALCIMDGEGHLLRQTGYDPVSVLQNVRDFGLDVTQLADIATQLDAKGIAYKPGELAPGSSLGTDFADLAKVTMS